MVHGKIHESSDIDLKVFVKNFKVNARKDFIADGIIISIRYYPMPPPPKYYECILIQNMLIPRHRFYEDDKSEFLFSKVLFDRNKKLKKYYDFMRKFHYIEKIYLIAEKLERIRQQFNTTKYLEQEESIQLNLHLIMKDLIYLSYLLKDRIKILYHDITNKNQIFEKEIIRGLKRFLDTKNTERFDLDAFEKFLFKAFSKGIKKLEKLVSNKPCLKRIFFKGLKNQESYYDNINILYTNISDVYIRIYTENLRFKDFLKIAEKGIYNQFVEYQHKRTMLEELIKNKNKEKDLIELCKYLIKTATEFYKKTGVERYEEEAENYNNLVKDLLLNNKIKNSKETFKNFESYKEFYNEFLKFKL